MKSLCLQCNKEINTFPSRIKKGMGKYCSNSCKCNYLWSQPEYKQHMKSVHKPIPENIEKLIAYNKSEIARKIMSERFKGKPGSMGMLGKKHSLETRNKMSELKKGITPKNVLRGDFIGEKNHSWVSDRTKLKSAYGSEERRSSIYKEWRKKICIRDSWKCKINNKDCKGKLEVHHILGFAEYPELKYDINNGITLCHFHHPRKREEEKRLTPYFVELMTVSKV